jgi:hypothetical protein
MINIQKIRNQNMIKKQILTLIQIHVMCNITLKKKLFSKRKKYYKEYKL